MRISFAIVAATAAITAATIAPAVATAAPTAQVARGHCIHGNLRHHSNHNVSETANLGSVKTRRVSVNTYLTVSHCRVQSAGLIITPKRGHFDCSLMRYATIKIQGATSLRGHCDKRVMGVLVQYNGNTQLPRADRVTVKIHLSNAGIWPDQHWRHTYHLRAS